MIGKMQAANYLISEEGLCYGIASIAIQSVIRGQADQYKMRITNLKKVDIESILKLENKQLSKSAKEFKYDILAFFDGIYFYQGKYLLNKISKDFLHIKQEQSLDAYSEIMSSHLEGFEKPQLNGSKLASYNKETLLSFLNKMQESNKDQPFALFIHFPSFADIPNHGVMIGFDGKSWLGVEHDTTLLSKSPENVVQAGMNELLQNDDFWTGSIEFFAKEKSLTIPNHNIFNIDAVPVKPLAMLALLRTAMMHDEIYGDNVENIKLITSKIINAGLHHILFDKIHLDFFYNLMKFKNSNCGINAYIKQILLADLTDNDKIFILSARSKKYFSSLAPALCRNHTQKVKDYLSLILSSNIHETGKFELISSLYKDKVDFFKFNFKQKNHDSFYAYFSTVLMSDLSLALKEKFILKFTLSSCEKSLKTKICNELIKLLINEDTEKYNSILNILSKVEY